MGARSTLILIGLVIVVGAYLWFADAPRQPADHADPGREQPPGAASLEGLRKLLAFEPADVVELQLQRGSRTYHVYRRDDAWQGAEDPSVINDFLHGLTELRILTDIAASASAEELREYGLDSPPGVIVLRFSGQTPRIVLQIGERNPATTGVYVRVGDDGPVVLAGALVEWEFDNLFKRLGAGG